MTAETGITLTAEGGDAIPVQALRLERGLSHPVGRAEILLPAGVTPPEPGAVLQLVARAGGTEVALMTGDVARVAQDARGARLSLLDPLARLNRHAPSRAFSGETAGGILGTLCDEAGVETGTLLPGLAVPHMVLGHWASLLDHARRLAEMSGTALVSGADGAVSTVALALPVPRGTVDTGRARAGGGDVTRAGTPPEIRVAGAGAMGTGGPGMTTLPLQDDALVAAGPDGAGRRARFAAIRSLADSTVAQLAAAQRLAAPHAGLRLTTPLPENLMPGDVVTVPDAAGLPVRLVRVEGVALSLTGAAGLVADYAFSDVRAA